ncbi:MAG: LuxR C-terminal-related transcriptional regulator [Gammaproteobacteria bacterium]
MIHPRQIVFIVSGDGCVRSELRHVLAAHGLHAIEFETAAGYRAGSRPEAPACLILDVDLPDMCGLDLQQSLAGACPPVLFVTRKADIALSVRAIKAGALDFLTIPLRPELLLRAVQAAIDLDASTRGQRERVKDLCERLGRLTPRERQVLPLVVSGMLNKQVASQLGISDVTVQIHRSRVMHKMGADSFADLVRIAEILRVPLDAHSRSARVEKTGSLRASLPVRRAHLGESKRVEGVGFLQLSR